MLYFLWYCSCFKVLIPMRSLTFVRRYTARHRWARRHPVTSWTFSEPSALPTKMCSEGNVLRRSYLTLPDEPACVHTKLGLQSVPFLCIGTG